MSGKGHVQNGVSQAAITKDIPCCIQVIQLREQDEDLYVVSLINSGASKEKAYSVWNRIYPQVKDGRGFIIIKDGLVVSRVNISDIDCKGGNISVRTDKNYRRMGFGKAVTGEAVKWCINNSIVPVHLVKKDNIASINTARSVGFEVLYKEKIISQKNDGIII